MIHHDMAAHSNDEPPVTTRARPPAVSRSARFAYIVEITYREPGYAERSGTHEPYSGRFVVHAADELDAVTQAKVEFESVAAASGVGWVRVIERIDCRRANDGEDDPKQE